MGKCQRRQSLVFIGKFRQLRDHVHQFLAHQLQSLRHDDNVRVIANITGSCSQMDNPLRLRTLYAVCIYMGHHIVADFLFSCLCHIIIDILRMCLQLIDLLLGNRQTQLFLGLRKCDPQLPPGPEFHIRRKNILHLFACITFG